MAKKRANGEGNIRKRKDGRWEGRFTAGHDPITGKPITKNVLARSQAEYKKKLREELNKAEVLDYTKADKITVGAWLDTWYENYVVTTLRPATVKNYETLSRIHIKPIIGDPTETADTNLPPAALCSAAYQRACRASGIGKSARWTLR